MPQNVLEPPPGPDRLNEPAALIGLLEGRNFGKLVVRVASDA